MLEAAGVTATYHRGSRKILDQVDLLVEPGTSYGVVGESGSGKTTLARTLCGLLRPVSGTIRLDGSLLWSPRGRWHGVRRVQYVPQDPHSSLNPRMRVATAIAEAVDPRRPRGRVAASAATDLLVRVGLAEDTHRRFPHELSGGQRQRVAIARAIATNPDVVVADEITSALDASVRLGILDLLVTTQQRLGTTMVFISHDLAVIARVCTHVAVMLRGQIVENGRTDQVLSEPRHNYTRLLLDSIPGRRRNARVVAETSPVGTSEEARST